MSLLQQACDTYDYAEKAHAGRYEAGKNEPLAPICHAITNAKLEITIDSEGNFIQGIEIDKGDAKTIFPVTEESAGRTAAPCAHPLCEQLGYLIPQNIEKYQLFIKQLQEWNASEYSHPMLQPILSYIEKGTLIKDLLAESIIKTDEAGVPKDEKAFIRWRVVGIGEESGACWKNRNLQNMYSRYYLSKILDRDKDVCMVSGNLEPVAKQHAKGIVSLNGNAKLISSNDSINFTYRGRFIKETESMTVGYLASQKSHNALRWVIANQGNYCAGRNFVCWNPQGKEIPKVMSVMRPKGMREKDKASYTPSDYKEYLRKILRGWKTDLPIDAKAIVAVFDAATTGRLSLSYYSEMQAADFLERLKYWDETCCWPNKNFGIQSPSLMDIVCYAFGTLRNNKIEADDGVMKQSMLKLVASRLERAKIPTDIERALVKKAGALMLYDDSKASNWLRNKLLFTTCAVIKKYRHDYFREEWDMALEKEKKDRSYQYGRLLAVLEKAERDTYGVDEDREPNAMRMQSVFTQRPQYAARMIWEQVKRGYYRRLSNGQRTYYEKLIGQIMEQLSEYEEEANKPLEDSYLLGYYLQKNEMYTSKNKEQKDN